MPGVKVLIVDDEQEICEITKNFLSRRNYTCFTAGTQDQALELVKREQPKLVLLDVRLGSISGLEVLAKIKQLAPETMVIMVTGLNDEASMQEAKALGAEDFITKPFTASFLEELIGKKIAKQ